MAGWSLWVCRGKSKDVKREKEIKEKKGKGRRATNIQISNDATQFSTNFLLTTKKKFATKARIERGRSLPRLAEDSLASSPSDLPLPSFPLCTSPILDTNANKLKHILIIDSLEVLLNDTLSWKIKAHISIQFIVSYWQIFTTTQKQHSVSPRMRLNYA